MIKKAPFVIFDTARPDASKTRPQKQTVVAGLSLKNINKSAQNEEEDSSETERKLRKSKNWNKERGNGIKKSLSTLVEK